MPVMILDVPSSAWNQVVLQSTMYGLDLCPDDHHYGRNTIAEITGTIEKLQLAFTQMKRWGPEIPKLLGVLGSKPNDQC